MAISSPAHGTHTLSISSCCPPARHPTPRAPLPHPTPRTPLPHPTPRTPLPHPTPRTPLPHPTRQARAQGAKAYPLASSLHQDDALPLCDPTGRERRVGAHRDDRIRRPPTPRQETLTPTPPTHPYLTPPPPSSYPLHYERPFLPPSSSTALQPPAFNAFFLNPPS